MGLYRSSSHVYWRCKYHIVWTPKYRFRILKDKLGKELYRTIYILCGIKGCEVLELNVQPVHVHLVVIVPPKISISTLMGILKVAVPSDSTIAFHISGRSYGETIFGHAATLSIR
ncbi:transposase IS200-family protein [Enterobacter kobei]|nr:transposase IS200-family protein [Enterobacter kobei]